VLVTSEIELGAVLRLTFRMPDGGQVSYRPVVVRNRRSVPGQGIKYGCQFQAVDEKDHGIQLFVARKIATERGESVPHPQILVLSRNELDVEMVQQSLANSPFEVIEAAGILDLGFRLHSCEAVGILISFEQRELSAIEVLPLIRQSPGMGEIPLFMYGGGTGLRDQALAMGATLCLNDLSETPRILPYLPEQQAPKPVTPPEVDSPDTSQQPLSEPAQAVLQSVPDEDEILLDDPS
jgi:hypothetical protein